MQEPEVNLLQHSSWLAALVHVLLGAQHSSPTPTRVAPQPQYDIVRRFVVGHWSPASDGETTYTVLTAHHVDASVSYPVASLPTTAEAHRRARTRRAIDRSLYFSNLSDGKQL